jgi:hypothetical protein
MWGSGEYGSHPCGLPKFPAICKIIWNLAKIIWEMKGEKWEKITYGKIMGCNLINLKDQKGKPKTGKNRLYTIIISESAFLIWKLRCQKVIEFGNGKDHSEIEIHNKWVNIINTRLKLDKILTNSHRYGSKAIPKDKVLKTWLVSYMMKKVCLMIGSDNQRL